MMAPLQYLEHTIRCTYGHSDTTYGMNWAEVPIQGIYQGNGAGPIIWVVVSSPLLQILKEDGFGTFFKKAISQNLIRIVGYAFVNDTDLIQRAQSGQTFIDINQEMQEAMDLWEGLIKNTGGALATDKCRWWGIDFVWSHGILEALDTNNIRQTIRQLETCDAYKTLGVWLAADGNHSKELDILKTAANEWADKIHVSFLSESEASQALC